MRDLKFLTICPSDTYFTWQVHLWLESLKEIGHSDKAIVLIYSPKGRPFNDKWTQIVKLYPEAELTFIEDYGEMNEQLSIYISVLRPYTAWRYFQLHPELRESAIFYCDSDILFTKDFNLDKFLDDDVNYVSDTNSYINADYFDSKKKDVLSNKITKYSELDVLNSTANLVGIDRKICEKNNLDSGGAQYLLKNIDAGFWEKVMKDCISIRVYLMSINREYFESEDKGYQSWCADMWAVLWNLWFRGQETKVVPELAFAWAPDPIQKMETHTIYHNAGMSGVMMDNYPCFYKGRYHLGGDPTKDPHLDVVLNNEESKKHCTWYYADAVKRLGEKYKLNY